jgi:tetratricopeptide (TPR) repeat protein
MPKENQTDPRTTFAPRFLPWLLGGAMFVVYWFTLNHWVTLLNLTQVANVTGWIWQPQIFNPLTYLVTLPFRWLPAAQVPLALNAFSALCGAATLAVLARSVAILPHDRTEMERTRERSDFSFLTGWVAWLPPVVAVFFAGLQLGFWEHATNFTGESFQLLWFAVILWQLLEYRLDEHEPRLYATAFLYGAGLAENWAMLGFFPVFLMMLIWLRKLEFFNLSFLSRVLLCGVAGLLLLVLLPLKAKYSGVYPLTFWQALKPNLQSDWAVMKLLKIENIRHDLGLISLTSLLPAFLMSIRWSSSFGDSSRLGTMLVNYFFHVVNAIIFGVLVWVMFDPPFSPHGLMQDMQFNVPALTLYYLIGLCIGYYCGYFLLVFGKAALPTRRTVNPDPALPQSLMWLCPVIVAGTLAAVALGAGLLIYKNAPIVRAVNDDTLLKYAQFTAQNLPPDGAILLCDNDGTMPSRAFLIQALLAREGREKNFPVVDTLSLNWPVYHQIMHRRFPKVWPLTATTNEIASGVISPLHIFNLLSQFSKSNNLCYLNPSFGYYFEQFYEEPRGLIYAMKPLPEDLLLPPDLNTNQLAENESFWTQVLASSRPAIEIALHPPDYKKQKGAIGWCMKHLHVVAEPNPNALMVGAFYSRCLNYFGVQVQRARDLDKAATLFAEAKELNPDNIAAAKNFECNKALRAGSPDVEKISPVTADQFGKYRNENEVLAACGPFDEPSFCFDFGDWFMRAGLFRQAAAAFYRVRQLAPDNLAARLFLAQIYIFSRQADKAQEMLHDPLTHPLRFAVTEFNATELNVLAAAIDFQQSRNAEGAARLESEIAHHPDDETLLLATVQSFMMRGLYTNALKVINHKLARTPDDLNWIFGQGFASVQVGAYNDAVKAFSRILEIQTNNADARYNRAFAYFQSDHFDAARADFLQLQAAYTNSFQVAYGLGEIAWRKHETNEAVRNYQIFLANAPTNSAELKPVRERLGQLKLTGDK